MNNEEIKRVISIVSPNSATTIDALRQGISELTKAQKGLNIESEEHRVITSHLTDAKIRLNSAVRGETSAVENSYKAINNQFKALNNLRKELDSTSEEYKQVTAEANALYAKLMSMDKDIGVHSRNVGNYSSAFDGLNMSVAQVARELPSLTMGANQFFLAISNNLPILYDNIKAYRAMAKEQKALGSVWSALGKALFSWNTLITIGITLLAAFGGEIVEWIKKLINGEMRLNATEKALRKFNDAIEENGLGVGEQITQYEQLRVEWGKLADDMAAKEQFIVDNKDAFDALGVAIGNVIDAEHYLVEYTDDVIEAMALRGKAMAAQKLASESYEAALLKQMELEGIPEYLPFTTWEGGLFSLKKVTRQAYNPDYAKASKELGNIEEEAQYFLDMMIAFLEEADALAGRFDKPDKTETTSKGSTIKEAVRKKVRAKEFTISWPKRDFLSSTIDYGDPLGDANTYAELETLKAENELGNKRIQQAFDLAQKLEQIEELRLTEHEIHLRSMLNSEELTVEERINLENELTRNLEEQTALRIRIAERERATKEMLLGYTADIMGNASRIFEENTVAHKGFASAQALMDTYVAANKALAEVPYPANWVAMAATITAGIANVASILDINANGDNVASSMSAPNVAHQMPASYTRQLMGDNELTELNKAQRVYVVESDITEAQKAAKARVEEASF